MPLKIPPFARSVRSVRRSSTRPSVATRASLESLEGRRLLAVSAVSVVDNTPATGLGAAQEPSVSADGRFVAFSSDAANLGPADANGVRDVYLHDRQTGDTILVSHNLANSGAGNGRSAEPSISQDGNFVSFSSTATDLVAGQPVNGETDIFIWERATGTIRLASVSAGGNTPSQFSAEPNTNGDGNFVAYTSSSNAGSMVTGAVDNNGVRDVFLWNATSNTNQLVSVTSGGTSGNRASFDPSVSANGQFVAFRSEADDLLPGVDTNVAVRDIYMRDVTGGATILVSRGLNGAAANGPSDSPSISADGNFIVFSSEASNLVANDTNGAVRDVFVFNRTTNTITLVSQNQVRTGSGNAVSSEPSISQDGRFVAFTSGASDLVVGDVNAATDIFLYDINTGAMNLVSTTTAGAQGNGDSSDANVAPGGQFVAFTSNATNLDANDANNASDAFVATAPDRQTGNTNPPAASISQADQPPASTGEQFLQFVVTYTDDVDLATTSFDNNDITVTAPGGGSPVAAERVSSVGSGTSAKVTYRIPAPGGTLDPADDGLYTLNVQANQVADANGNFVPATTLPAVQVTVTPPDGPDLTVTIPDTLPSAVGGSRGRARVVVTNSGNQPVPRRSSMTLTLYLSADDVPGQAVTVAVYGKPPAPPPTLFDRIRSWLGL
jgi:Tol biopolymer transport system component